MSVRIVFAKNVQKHEDNRFQVSREGNDVRFTLHAEGNHPELTIALHRRDARHLAAWLLAVDDGDSVSYLPNTRKPNET